MTLARLQDTRATYKRSVVFLYTRNQISENEIRKPIPKQQHQKNKLLKNKFNNNKKSKTYTLKTAKHYG